MKLITPDSTAPTGPLSVLLIGPPGGGKTTFTLTFPNLCILDCDRNLDGPCLYLRSIKKLRSFKTDSVWRDGQSDVEPWDLYDRLLDLFDEVSQDPEVKWVCVDSLTHVNEFIVRKVLREQKNATLMQPHFWGPFNTHLLRLLVIKARGSNKNFIGLVHETWKEREGGDKFTMDKTIDKRKPTIQGGVAKVIGGLFTDMWRISCDRAPGDRLEYKLETQRTAWDDLKNSLGMPAVIREPSYEKVLPYLTAAGYA